ncbi:MAG TPA: TIGR01212 family radical SAM protein [Deltaproteobacteria bacterium]|nr:TIGR01212 family radical SAM protein [Deltaproteobacteria bacterium]
MTKPEFWNNNKRYYDFKSFLINTFGCKAYKLQIDAGFTCPNRDGTISTGGCIYCNSQFSNLRQTGPLPTIKDQICRGKKLYARMRGAKKFIAYFQTATNTYAPREKLKILYDEALLQEDIIGIAVGTRPDCVPDDVIDLFESYARDYNVWIEYGLQSIHDRTLDFINRGHHAETFIDAVERTAGRNINICVHMIVGLPGETRYDALDTARSIASLPVNGIKIHLLLALEGTVLGDLYKAEKIKMIQKDEYIATVCDILEILPPHMVIQRLTADGYRDKYLAPDWGRNKMDVLNSIDKELERRNSWQGLRFNE